LQRESFWDISKMMTQKLLYNQFSIDSKLLTINKLTVIFWYIPCIIFLTMQS